MWEEKEQKMKIREAKAGDEKKIADVIISTWKVAYRGIVPDDFLDVLTTEQHEKLFKKNISEKTETILVLENNAEKVVGMISGGVDRSREYDCEIVAIYILPEYQKKGLGSCLFKEMITSHKRHNYKTMVIWTFKENKDSGFYEKLGGEIRLENTCFIGNTKIPIVGFIWDDINRVVFT